MNLNGGLNSLALHGFIILMKLRIGTSGYNIRYTSEYIPKLQIHKQNHLFTHPGVNAIEA